MLDLIAEQLGHDEFSVVGLESENPTVICDDGTTPEIDWEVIRQIHTIADAKATFIQEIQRLHDTTAQAAGYDNINSCGKYCGYDNPYMAECEALAGWAAECWQVAYAMLAQWEAGEIEAPSIEVVLEAMPTYVAP